MTSTSGLRDGRARLLAAATELYVQRGASNVGINDVIESAGVARMTLYNNFKSKEELTEAVYTEMIAAMLSRLDELDRQFVNRRVVDEHKKLLAMIDLLAAGIATPESRGCPFIHASLQESDPSGGVTTLVRSYKKALRDRVLSVLDPARCEREDVADQILILLDGMVTEIYLGAVAQPVKKVKRVIAAILASTD